MTILILMITKINGQIKKASSHILNIPDSTKENHWIAICQRLFHQSRGIALGFNLLTILDRKYCFG